MVATTQQKTDMARKLASLFASENITGFIDKNEALLVVEDAYNWAEANQGGYNTALLLAFRTNASTRLKTQLLEIAIKELVQVS